MRTKKIKLSDYKPLTKQEMAQRYLKTIPSIAIMATKFCDRSGCFWRIERKNENGSIITIAHINTDRSITFEAYSLEYHEVMKVHVIYNNIQDNPRRRAFLIRYRKPTA